MLGRDRIHGLEINDREANLSYLSSELSLLAPLNFSSRSSGNPLSPPPNGVAPSDLRFSLDNTHYTNTDTLTLKNGWVRDADNGEDIARLDLQLLQDNTAIGEIRRFDDFAIASWNPKWANFSTQLNLTDWGTLPAGTYHLQATAYDRFGNASTPFSRAFLLATQPSQNAAPTDFRFGLQSSQYGPDETLKLIGGWIYDADGAIDLAGIDLQIQDSQGTILHETNTDNFTPASWSPNWASFNSDIDLTNLGLNDNNYIIKGVARDRTGASSEAFSRSFAIASPDRNEAPSNFSFSLENANYSDRDTLNLRHGWVKDGDGIEDLDKIEWSIWQAGTQIALLDNTTQFSSATWDNRETWASFSYSIKLENLGLESGEYSLRGITYDRAGETSTPFERRFLLAAINNAPTLLFNLDLTAISPTENLSITGGFVQNEAGISEIEQITFKLIKNDGSFIDLGATNSFTPSSENEEWGSFDREIDLSQFGLVAGEYKLQGIARDRAGKESEMVERIFTIKPPDSSNNDDVELAWAKAIGGLGDQNGIDIAIDSEGNSYIVGTFPNNVDFDPGSGVYNLTSNGGTDVYVAKLDADGNFLWAKALGGVGDDWAGKILLDSQNDIYIKGIFQNTVDFDPGNGIYNLSSLGSADSFVLKLDNTGNFLWAKNWKATESSSGGSIVLDSQDSLYVLGSFEGAIDTGSGILTSTGSKDLFISKLDRNGNFLWTKTTGGSSVEEGYDITLDRQGNIYLTGLFAGTADFDPSAGVYELATPGPLYDSFVVKLDGQGNFIWARGTESPGFNYSTRIAVDSQGGVYSLGIFAGTLDFASGSEVYNLTSQSEADIYVWKLDASGDLQWVKQAGNSDVNIGTGIEIDRQDNIYITGLFKDTADFDPGMEVYHLTSAGDSDAFIWTLDRDGNLQWAKNMGGSGADIGSQLAISDRGEVYLIGGFENTGDFDPGDDTFTLTSPDALSIFVTKLQPASNTPISVDFNLNKTAYRASQTLNISSGNVSDRDGISDLSHIDFRLRYGDGTLIDLSDVNSFTPSNTDYRQGFFDYNLNLGALALTEGNYSLWATVYDRNGMASEVFEQNFIIGEIPNFDPTSLSFALNANNYLDTDTLTLESGEVFDLNGATDIARIDFQINRPDGTLLDVGDVENFVARSQDNRWVDFSYNLDLNALNLTSGGYSLEGIAYDSTGRESRYFAQRFTVTPSNVAPASLDFALVNSQTTTNGTLEITNGLVYDENGISDLANVDFRIVKSDGTEIDAIDVTNFIASGTGTRWANFDYSLDLSNFNLEAGDYKLQGIAYDIVGEASNVMEREFAIGSPPSNIELVWAKRQNYKHTDESYDIALDNQGNIYTIGYGIHPLNPTILISKQDREGNMLWSKTFGSNNDDYGYGITIDNQGNIYATGIFSGIVDFDPSIRTYNLSSQKEQDFFTLKLDTDGNFIWVKSIGGFDNNYYEKINNNIKIDKDGNVYTVSSFEGRITFEQNNMNLSLRSKGELDAVISKLDTDGNFLWVKQIGGFGSDVGTNLEIDFQGNIYMTGSFYGKVDFDPSTHSHYLTSHGQSDIFIAKLNTNGDLLWAKNMGGNNLDAGQDIAVDTQGNIYILGIFRGVADFDPSSNLYKLNALGNLSNTFISKLDYNGNFIWAKSAGSNHYTVGNRIAIDNLDNVYSIGFFRETANFDSGNSNYFLTSQGFDDTFIWKLDRYGQFQWAKQIGDRYSDRGNSIILDDEGNIYTTGTFHGTVDFDLGNGIYNLTSENFLKDIFVAKYKVIE